MNSYNETYKQLKKQYTKEEIADFAIIPNVLEDKDVEPAHKEFIKLRMALRKNRTSQEKLLGKLLGIKYQIKSYIESQNFNPNMTFGVYLRQYSEIVKRTPKELANDININLAQLNRILTGKEQITKKLAYRLEQHSGTIIPAIYWWKLMQKEVEQEILMEKTAREIEKKQVTFIAYLVD